MKKLLIAVVASSPGFVFASGPGLTFPDAKIDIPATSLAEMAQQGVPSLVAFMPVEVVTRVSRMPVIDVGENYDPKIVSAPDSGRDYKLVVKSPELELRK
jgi:hypothetical protein